MKSEMNLDVYGVEELKSSDTIEIDGGRHSILDVYGLSPFVNFCSGWSDGFLDGHNDSRKN
jgi:hypothetical protein